MDDAVKTHAAGGDRGGLAPRNRNSGATSGPHGGGEPHGTPLRLGTQSRHGRRAPPERRFTVGGSGKSAARCHRTVLAYWKFESISLQRGVRCELDLAEGGFADEIAAAPPGVLLKIEWAEPSCWLL